MPPEHQSGIGPFGDRPSRSSNVSALELLKQSCSVISFASAEKSSPTDIMQMIPVFGEAGLFD